MSITSSILNQIDKKPTDEFPFKWDFALDAVGISKNPLYNLIDWSQSSKAIVALNRNGGSVYLLNLHDT